MATYAKTTQDFLPIKEIRDGTVILKNGGLRMVMIASSLNFSLKSADEQMAILSQYQSFLNSLDFSLQIFMQSRKLDIKPYIGILEERVKEQTNDLLKIQTKEYIDFIKTFTDSTNIMAKAFFIVVPYDPPIFTVNSGLLSRILPSSGKKKGTTEGDNFEEYRSQLEQRVSVVEQGLSRIGIRIAPLGTEELVELYFKLFNPGETDVPTIK